jgi:DNA polymerase-3 subunit alpha
VNKRTLDALISAGALDALGKNRATLSAASEAVAADAARRREETELGQTNLFAGGSDDVEIDHFPELPEWSLEAKLLKEKEVLGFYVTGHPLTRYAEDIDRFGDARVSDLAARIDRTVRIAGVLVNVKKQKIKKGVNEGKTMLKANLEDTTGSVPVCVFASLYEKIGSWIRADLPVLTTAIVREAGGAIELTVQEVTPLEGIRERLAREMEVRINLTLADETLMGRLKDLLRLHSGTTPLALRLVRPGDFEVKLKAADSIRVTPSPRLTGELRALTGEDSVRFLF